jgi:hypothetical protein
MYGLLGGHLEAEASDRLRIDVSVSAAKERKFVDSLAMKGDDVRVGLPPEYVQAVLAGVKSAMAQLNAVTAGKLSINCAAHGAIGSSEVIYKHLGAILIKLFNLTSSEPSDDELFRLFPSTFN